MSSALAKAASALGVSEGVLERVLREAGLFGGTVYTPEFESFWKVYPKRVGKPDAFKAWQRANGDSRMTEIIDGVKRWMQTHAWSKDNGEFVPYPATFLNQRRWEDQPDNPAPEPPPVVQLTDEAKKFLLIERGKQSYKYSNAGQAEWIRWASAVMAGTTTTEFEEWGG